MAGAITAAESGGEVILAEGQNRIGKKLLATGNGRCNLMNTGAPNYPGGQAFAEKVLSVCGVEQQKRFWHAHGLRLREEQAGRVYPVSGQASTVLDVLRFSAEVAGVSVFNDTRIKQLTRTANGFVAKGDHGTLRADRVIVACGGKAQPKLGSDGSGYALLTGLGHTLISPVPALTQVETETRAIAGLSGIRVRCGVQTERDAQVTHAEYGEVLFTDYGLSGVCVMQCARYCTPRATGIALNLAEGMGFDHQTEVISELKERMRRMAEQPLERLLTGLCVPRLSDAVFRAAAVSVKGRSCVSLSDGEINALAKTLWRFVLRVTGLKGFDSAQVTSGGIACDEFNPRTMASKMVPGLYAAGEILDVDGDCGGFNLMFAFGSGIIAGTHCARD